MGALSTPISSTAIKELSKSINDFNDLPTDELDTLVRVESTFGDRERAEKAAAIVSRRIRESIEKIRAERKCSHTIAFDVLSRDERDMYLNAQAVLSGGSS